MLAQLNSLPTSEADNLFAILTRSAPSCPEQPFLVRVDGTSVTFGQMLEETGRVAVWLKHCGLGNRDRVVAQIDKSIAAVIFYLGCLRSGVVYVPLNNAYTGTEVEYFLSDAEPSLLVASPSSPAASVAFQGHRELLSGELGHAPWSRSPTAIAVAQVGPNDPAVMLYTSGTTGRSKGAVLTHRNLSSNALVLQKAWRWREGDVLLHALPIFHAHGLFVALHGALLNGSTIRFHERFDAAAVVRDLPNATVFMGVPTFYTRLLDDRDFTAAVCARMRVFISGSAPMPEATFMAFKERTGHEILERYGMTEATMVTSNPYDGPRRPGTVGRPLPGIDVRITGTDRSLTERNQPGILELKGPNLFAGYWRNPEKTREDHTPDGYFVSGDLAVWDEEGFIKIVGRVKDLIITGGFNVYPKEIEVAIDAIAGVTESAVIGVPHPDFGEGVVAVVVLRDGAAVDARTIRSVTEQKLAPFKRPKEISSSRSCRATRWARFRRRSSELATKRLSPEPSIERTVMPIQLPTPIHKPAFDITRASHIVHRVRDLAASRAFYVNLLGLVVSDEDRETIWLRGLEEGCHHSLVLKLGESQCERVGLRVRTEEDLDLLDAHFARSGFPTTRVKVAHQGATLHTRDPAGTPLEFCAVMETRPRLFHHVELYQGACAQRLDHFQVITPEIQSSLNFYSDMGFRLSEYVVDQADDSPMMVFLQRKGNPHDIVFAKGHGPRLHHVAYTVPETQNLMTTADLFVRAGHAAQVEFGPARHFSPGLARFLYLRDPDGHRVELFPSHYQTIDIEDEPIRWQAPDFQIGGWQTPPQRWFDEASAFVRD